LTKFSAKGLSSLRYQRFSKTLTAGLASQLKNQEQKNAVRFESQNKTWTYKELDRHSNAFVNGILELGYKKGDRFLFWIDKAFPSEITIAQIALAKAGVSIVNCDIKDAKQLDEALKDTEAKGVLFSPNTKYGDKKAEEILNEAIPGLKNIKQGDAVNLSSHPKLKHLVHVGFYSQPGTMKYRQLMVYGKQKFLTNKLSEEASEKDVLYYVKQDGKFNSYTQSDIHNKAEEFRKFNNIGEDDALLVVGDSNTPSSFAYGTYNSLAFGNYVVLTGNQNFKDVLGKLHLQKSSVLVINEDLQDKDLTGSLDSSNVSGLKNVFYRKSESINENNLASLFGGKKPHQFQANF